MKEKRREQAVPFVVDAHCWELPPLLRVLVELARHDPA